MKARLLYWWRRDGIGYLFMLPFLVLLLIFIVIPVFVALGTSFTNYNMLQKPRWIGLNNYKLLFMDDAIFLTALKNTFVFACITGPIGYIMSFVAAWLINQLRLRNAFSLAFYAPSITSGVAMSVVCIFSLMTATDLSIISLLILELPASLYYGQWILNIYCQ